MKLKKYPRYLNCAIVLVFVISVGVFSFDTRTALSANPPPKQLFFNPLPEDDLLQLLDDDGGGTPYSPIRSITAISIGVNGTLIYWDQWEDGGYDPDIANPGANVYDAATNPDGTQIWGDGVLANGCPPSINGTPNPCLTASDDLLGYGQVVVLDNNVIVNGTTPGPYSRNPAQIFFDGRDKMGATEAVIVTRGALPLNPGSVMAGGVEVFDSTRWGTQFIAPLGENTPAPNTQSFEDMRWFIIAGVGGSTIDVDANADGDVLDPGDLDDFVMAEGAKRVVDGILEGATLTVVSGYPVQVTQMAADVGSTYEFRWDALTPRYYWKSDYVTPVGTQPKTGNAGCTEVWVYNPNAAAITVYYDFPGGSSPDGSFSVPARDATNSPIIPYNNGARLYTTGSPAPVFLPISVTDCTRDTSGGGDIYDWGNPLFPVDELSSELLVGWAPGCTNDSHTGICRDPDGSPPYAYSRNVVFVTPLANTTIYVDLDGTGITCPGGVGADRSITATALTSYRINHDPTSRQNVRDEFSTRAYTNNNGSQTWTTNWIETGDGGSPTGGAIWIPTTGGVLQFRNIAGSEAGRNIRRSRNLAGQFFARLSFQIQSSSLDATDDLIVEVSSDGTTWYALRQYEGPITTQRTEVFNISRYISANTAVRFRFVDDLETEDYWNIDNVNIDYAPDGDFDMTGSYIRTCDGTKLAAAYGQDPALSASGDSEALDLGTGTLPYFPNQPTAVLLAGFSAEYQDQQVLLTWETAMELDVVGFNLYRAESPDGERTKINDSLIPSQSLGGPIGAFYQFIDLTAQPGGTYYYWLEIVDSDGTLLFGPQEVTLLRMIYLPIIKR